MDNGQKSIAEECSYFLVATSKFTHVRGEKPFEISDRKKLDVSNDSQVAQWQFSKGMKYQTPKMVGIRYSQLGSLQPSHGLGRGSVGSGPDIEGDGSFDPQAIFTGSESLL